MQCEDRFYYLVGYVNQENPNLGLYGPIIEQFLVSKLRQFKNSDFTFDFHLNSNGLTRIS